VNGRSSSFYADSLILVLRLDLAQIFIHLETKLMC